MKIRRPQTKNKNDNKLRSLSIIFALFLCFAQCSLTSLLADSWQLPFFWAIFCSQAIISAFGARHIRPDLIKERLRLSLNENSDALGPLLIGILYPTHLALAALDVGQWHFSDNVPLPVRLIALISFDLSWAGYTWTMCINAYFSSAVRVQLERGHIVITKGPYGYVRHPGYAFLTLALLAQMLALGSWIASAPVFLIVMHLVYRIGLEEKVLSKHLSGYSDYLEKVRFRLIPYLW